MWTWIKKTAAAGWTAGVKWLSVPANQKTAIDAGKQLIDRVNKKDEKT